MKNLRTPSTTSLNTSATTQATLHNSDQNHRRYTTLQRTEPLPPHGSTTVRLHLHCTHMATSNTNT
ncbi:hypothetical protein HanRHA438_Chr16g0768691 [Helianthus annuus]|nr:hypothetical protein HanRHA438_Chr16g0768691 [Helianthus annuus]